LAGLLTDPLLYARALHFAATMLLAGVVLFAVLVAAPAWRGAASNGAVAINVRTRLAVMAWIGIALAAISGAAWLILTAAAMSGLPAAQVFGDGVLWTVLSETTFGRAWLIRFVLACALAATLPALLSPRDRKSTWLEIAAAVLAAAFAGALAWSGHAAGGLGGEAIIHPAADVLHLVAAAAWVGALLPLIVLFAAAGADDASLAMARTATVRFSILGIVSVGTLLATGIVNTFYLAGSVPALLHTEYGRLLLIKIVLFLAMVAIAAINRFQLTPQLLQQASIAASRDRGFGRRGRHRHRRRARHHGAGDPRRPSAPDLCGRSRRRRFRPHPFGGGHGGRDHQARAHRTRARNNPALGRRFRGTGGPASEHDADRPRRDRQPDIAPGPATPRWRLASR
jgi:putative copper resistance protein D